MNKKKYHTRLTLDQAEGMTIESILAKQHAVNNLLNERQS